MKDRVNKVCKEREIEVERGCVITINREIKKRQKEGPRTRPPWY